jgi:hypothetical protein
MINGSGSWIGQCRLIDQGDRQTFARKFAGCCGAHNAGPDDRYIKNPHRRDSNMWIAFAVS